MFVLVHLFHFASLAHAHVLETVTSLDVLTRGSAEPLDIEAAYGLLLDMGGEWRWVCHEAITEPDAILRPRYTRSTDGQWLGVVADTANGRRRDPSDELGQTMFVSDNGCTWDHVDGLDGHTVVQAEFDALDDEWAWAITASAELPNAVYVSTDGGRTWLSTLALSDDLLLSSLTQTGDSVWASGIDSTNNNALLYQYNRTLEIWSERTVELPSEVAVPLVGFAIEAVSEDETLLWARFDLPGTDVLVRSDDGGQTWTVIDSDAGVVTDVEMLPDGEVVVFSLTGDSARRAGPDGSMPLDLPGPEGMAVVGDQWFLATDSSTVQSLLQVSTDEGKTWEILGYPDSIVAPLDCPTGSHVLDICRPLWDTLFENVRGFDQYEPPPANTNDDRPPIEPPTNVREDCGCGSAVPMYLPSTTLLAVVCWGFRRRRRLSCETTTLHF